MVSSNSMIMMSEPEVIGKVRSESSVLSVDGGNPIEAFERNWISAGVGGLSRNFKDCGYCGLYS